MTDELVKEAIRSWIIAVADRLELPNSLDMQVFSSNDQIIKAVNSQNPTVGAALSNFVEAYQKWWSLSKNGKSLPSDERQKLLDAIVTRDDTRQKLIEAMK